MNIDRQNVVDIDVGRPPFPSRASPTFRFHVHDFQGQRHRIISPDFTCFGRHWTVEIYPQVGAGGTWVSFFLTMGKEVEDCDSDSDSSSSSDDSIDSYDRITNVRFSASVKDLDGNLIQRRDRSHKFNHYNDEKGFCSLVERAAIIGPSSNVLRDGTLTIELEMKLLGEKRSVCQPFVPSNPLAQNIKKLFLDEKTADVEFAVGKDGGPGTVNFCAHRLVLQANARNLAAFCDSSNSNELTPIPISRVDPEVFKLMLFYVYGGTISTADWKLHCTQLLDAADLYGVINLKLEAEARYVKCTAITTDNLVDILRYADSKQCAHLKELVYDFVVQNKKDVLKQVASLKNVPESSTMFTDLLAAMARDDKGTDGSDEEPLDTMRIGGLRRKLHEKGLDVDGSREALVARLKENSKKSGGKRKRTSQNAIVEIEWCMD